MSRSIRPTPHLTIHHPRPVKRLPITVLLVVAVTTSVMLTLLLSLLLSWVFPH